MKKLCALFLLSPCYFMGAMDAPHAQYKIIAGASSRCGTRKYMEDEMVMIPDWHRKTSFLAVYDGHDGNKASLLAARNLHEYLNIQLKNTPSAPRELLLKEACAQTEAALDKINEKSGTTAVIAYIESNRLYCAWIGDSRAILVRDGKVFKATQDHKPHCALEKKRIIKNGGTVTEPILRHSSRALPMGLAMSRALGDIVDKRKKGNAGIIAEPEMFEEQLRDNDFLILASDGLWDELSNDEVAKKVNQLYQNYLARYTFSDPSGNDIIREDGDSELKKIATSLRDCAYRRGSTDNISVIVVAIKEQKQQETKSTTP